MDRFEAARTLGLSDADVHGVEATKDGTKVVTRDGGDRLIRDDGIFALTDHPSTKQFRRWVGDEPEAEAAEDSQGEGAEEPGEDPDGAGVPDGTAEGVLAWVGDDQARAKRALDVEVERDHPRSTLVEKLRKLAG